MNILLSQMDTDETAEIISVNKSFPLARRLCDLGFSPGQKINCCNKSIFGSPIAYNIYDTKIALRKKMRI